MAFGKDKVAANWVELDPASLEARAAKAYAMYKDMYRKAKEARLEFEQTMQEDAGLPEGKRMIFGYNFGKLSVAVVADEGKPKKAVQAKQSLAQFIASQTQAGLKS